MKMPGFNADGSLYKASERYAAVTSFAQTERAIHPQNIDKKCYEDCYEDCIGPCTEHCHPPPGRNY
jgi:hypothetical protein